MNLLNEVQSFCDKDGARIAIHLLPSGICAVTIVHFNSDSFYTDKFNQATTYFETMNFEFYQSEDKEKSIVANIFARFNRLNLKQFKYNPNLDG